MKSGMTAVPLWALSVGVFCFLLMGRRGRGRFKNDTPVLAVMGVTRAGLDPTTMGLEDISFTV